MLRMIAPFVGICTIVSTRSRSGSNRITWPVPDSSY
jgi:hypothetical protein